MTSQALLLAAGFSTRLRPLTNKVPKLLLPFLHVRMLDMQLAFLKHFGLKSFAINVHHGADEVLKTLKEIKDFHIQPYVETPAILGTGGGIFNMKGYVKDDHVVIINSDVLCGVDLHKAFAFHLEKKALVTMVIIASDEHKYGSVGVAKNGEIALLRKQPSAQPVHASGVYSGIQIVRKELFDELVPEGEFDFIEKLYIPLMQKNAPLYGYIDRSFWLDIGELATYLPSQFALLQANPSWAQPLFKGIKHIRPDIWVDQSAQLDNTARLSGPIFIGPGCSLKLGAELENTALSKDVTVQEHAKLKNCFVYPEQTVPAQQYLLDKVIRQCDY